MKKDSDEKKISSFQMLRRISVFIKPFIRLFVLSIFLNILFSTFDAITIASIKPVFQLIFPASEETEVRQTPANDDSMTEIIPTPESLTRIKDDLYQVLNDLIEEPGDKIATLINLGIFIIIAFILKNFFKYLSSVVSLKLQEGVIKSIRDKVFDRLTSLPIGFFTKSRSGNLMSIITNDVTALNNSTISSFTTVLRETTKILLFLVILFSISTNLSFIAFSTSIVSLVLVNLAMKYIRRYAKRMQSAMADYTSTLQESISGIKVVKAYNAEDSANGRFFSDTARYVRSAIKHKKIIALIPSINEIFAILALCVVLFVGGVQVINNEMPPDELMTFLFALFAIMNPISLVINAVSKFQLGYVAAGRVFTILDEEPEKETGKKVIDNFNDTIEISGLDFAYDEGAVIKDVSLKIKKCTKVAFVGASGSGKSTMLDLIVRFYDPAGGRITIDGSDIKEYTLKSYRSLFGIVAQESILFNDSLSNNIKFGSPDADDNTIEESAKVSNAHGFISKLPERYNTYIGDRGVMLSGGERQRVSIARALVRDPEILIFDEATSALDSESEKIVQEAINHSLENRTAIIVAHRLATIIDCDEIFVFDKGRITEHGSHSELLEKNGVYRKLYDIQFAANQG